MPGRHITDHQMELYMTHRKKDRPALAAARSGFSTATAYRIEADPGRPSEKERADVVEGANPFGAEWHDHAPMICPHLTGSVPCAPLVLRSATDRT